MKKLFDLIVGILTAILSVFVILQILDKDKPKVGEKKIKPLDSKISRYIKANKLDLNDRQILILKQFENNQLLYPLDIYKLLPDVSTRTIRRDMSHLAKLGAVVQQGSTKDTRYLLNI